MRRQILALSLALLLVLGSALPVLAAADLAAALDYLRTQQNADGGFGSGFAPGSTPANTADAVLAIVAAGGDPAAFEKAAGAVAAGKKAAVDAANSAVAALEEGWKGLEASAKPAR